jgi:hypothetical protein
VFPVLLTGQLSRRRLERAQRCSGIIRQLTIPCRNCAELVPAYARQIVNDHGSANGGNAMIVTLCQIGNDASDSCL